MLSDQGLRSRNNACICVEVSRRTKHFGLQCQSALLDFRTHLLDACYFLTWNFPMMVLHMHSHE